MNDKPDNAEESRQRTDQQNRALHLFCRLLSKALNDAGLDQRKVMKPEVEIPWNEESVKTNLWKPIQEAMFGIQSTADATTKDYNQIYEVLTRHLQTKLGVEVPAWPDRFSQAEQQSTLRQEKRMLS